MRALIKASQQLKAKEIYTKFSGAIIDLKEIVPETKVKEYENIKKIV